MGTAWMRSFRGPECDEPLRKLARFQAAFGRDDSASSDEVSSPTETVILDRLSLLFHTIS